MTGFQVGQWFVEPQINSITNGDKITHVEPKVMQVLACLAEQAGEVVLKEKLIRRVWGDTFVTDDVLTRSISELRKVFGDDAKEPRFIQTIPRSGYRLIAPVSCGRVGQEIDLQAAAVPSQATVAVRRRQSWRATRLIWLAAVFVLVIAGAVRFYFSRPAPEPSPPPMMVVPLTGSAGREYVPTFSPDGNQVAFVWFGEGDGNADIYVKLIGTETLLRLTSDPGSEYSVAWSPDGRQIAFMRDSANDIGIFTVPAIGGPERKLFSLIPRAWGTLGSLDWSPDGKYLMTSDKNSPQEPYSTFLLSVERLEKLPLTPPPADHWGDLHSVFSPDGKTIAFTRWTTSAKSDIYVVPTAGGEPRRLTYDNGPIVGLTWTADGREIVFSSNRGGLFGLWRISASGGEPERLPVGGDSAFNPSISRRGGRLAYVATIGDLNIYRSKISDSTSPGSSPTKLIASARGETGPQFSPDGRRIAFESNRSGSNEIWMCDSEGLNPVQLTHFGGRVAGTPRWSPDGRQIAFDSSAEGNFDVFAIGTDGVKPRRITTEPSEDTVPSWSRDGLWIYFASNRSGDWQVWKIPAEGGQAVQVTKQGGFAAFESPDGKFVYYAKGSAVAGLWRVPVEGGEEAAVLNLKEGYWAAWALAGRGIYFINPDAKPGVPGIECFNLATGSTTQIATLNKRTFFPHGLAVSPDEKWIIYVQADGTSSAVMLVENFR